MGKNLTHYASGTGQGPEEMSYISGIYVRTCPPLCQCNRGWAEGQGT